MTQSDKPTTWLTCGKAKSELDRTWIGLASGLVVSGLLTATSGNKVLAQVQGVPDSQSRIVPDRTQGSENSTVSRNNPDRFSDVIDGGARRGANLFHSFQEFNVGNARSVYFTNPAGVENILGRVTGANPSEILGRLGVLGNANLFLMNPNGIIFGPLSSLDVNGSFLATTANAIQLGGRGLFSASNPNESQLLSVNPSAFLFNQIAAQQSAIEHRGSLRVPDGKSLLLLGGNINLDFGYLFAPGGRVELSGVSGV
jgi:filamentous hemagglutinin family protein